MGLIVGFSEASLGVTVTLHYEIEDGSAILGEDYVPAIDIGTQQNPNLTPAPDPDKVTGTIILSPTDPGVFVKPGDYGVSILILEDQLVENDETYTVRLFPPPRRPAS